MASALSAPLARQRLSQVNPDAANYFMEKLLFQIYDHFDEQHLIDVTFKLSNPSASVTGHRLILSAASPYFNQLFKSDAGIFPVIEITDIDSETFERLITFCYTGKTLITIDNVEQTLKASICLQLADAVANCVDFLIEHITSYTLERTYALERDTQCALLSEKMLYYELENFMNVMQSTAFLNFDANKLKTILESDDLNVANEKDAFESVKRWYEHDASARKQQLADLISCLRLNQFDTNFLLNDIQPLPGCRLLAMEAVAWVNVPSSRATVSLKFTNPRSGRLIPDSTFFALNVWTKTYVTFCDVQSRVLFQYNKTEDSWHKWADIETDVDEFDVVLMEDNLVLIGGRRNGEILNEVRSWNFKTKTFQLLPSMNLPRYAHCLALLNNNIYAIGGRGVNGEFLKSVEMYSVSKGWTSLKSMITPRAFCRAVVLNEKIYVLGGQSESYLKSVECYDPTTNCWTQRLDMNITHSNPAATVHNGHIFVVGGRSGTNSPTEELYDPQRNEWTQICPLHSGLQLPGCISIDNELWTVGGYDGENKDCVSVYDEQNDKWIYKNKIPIPGQYYCFTIPNNLLKIDQQI